MSNVMNNEQAEMTDDTGAQQSGWVMFAGCLMVMAGLFHMITGLVALFQPTVVYLTTASNLLVLDYTQWGWTHLLIGVIVTASAASLFAGKLWGRIFAVFMATVSAIANFGFISSYPLWSLMIIAIDVMIIYSITVNGGLKRA
ncbi:MAG: hypothetical protein ABWX90_03115 [Candidatus Saccharimonadales bacterium]